jgi:hypothetical protein
MRNYLLFVTICAIACSGKKHNADYTSTQEDEYYKSRNYKEFRPARLSYIDSLHYDFLTITPSSPTNAFKSVFDRTAYNQYYDSLTRHCKSDNCFDSLRNIQFNHKIGEIYKYSILRYDSLGPIKIIFYTSSELEKRGYWIALSNDFGRSWKQYHTGLVENKFYFIKRIGKIPLIKNINALQLEFAIVRETQPEMPPVGQAKYELVRDNLMMEIDLTKLVKDSDEDGLTDLLENTFFIDPHNKDTDNDGIDDLTDKNPRYKNEPSHYSLLYNYLLEHTRSDSVFVPFDKPILDQDPSEHRDTIVNTWLIVTDDVNLLRLEGTKNRYILMSSEEYKAYSKLHYSTINQLHLSPLFEIDNDRDCRKIYLSRYLSRSDYIITEEATGWTIKYIGGIII